MIIGKADVKTRLNFFKTPRSYGQGIMNYQLLGKSGLRVSELCLGTMTFGEEWGWGSNKDESKAVFDAYIEVGGNFLDTADGYTNGTSEKMVGEFIRGRRDEFVVATKFSFNQRRGDPNAGGNHRKNMTQALHGSLKRLGTDYIDLYWMHAWDELTPIEEVMRAFDDFVRAGKVLYIGISDAPAWWVARANTIAELRGWTQFVGLQVEYNLIERTPERELLPMAETFGMTLTPWSPLASGWLTGKYIGKAKEERRLDKTPQFARRNERSEAIAKTVVQIAKAAGKSSAQVALNWLRARKNTIPIIGARKVEQLKDNLNCVKWSLNAKQLAELNEVSAIESGFPRDFLDKPFVHDYLHGGLFERIKH
jgi:aryl-alcohol dehydrogenase-like predicted oxidoreductase